MGRVEHEIDKWIGAASMMWEVYIPFKAFVSNALMLHVINSEKPLNCCCHLLQHLKGSHNVHSTVRCFLLISPFFMGVFPPSTFQPRWDSYFFPLFFHGIKKLSLKQQEKLVGITAPLLVKSIKRLKVGRFQTSYPSVH